MILSNAEIHRALDERRLILNPEPQPRIPDHPNVDCPYQASAVDLLLGDEISYFKDDLPLNIDLRGSGFAKFFAPNSNRTRITNQQPFVLSPKRLVLGRTHEYVELPIGSDGE